MEHKRVTITFFIDRHGIPALTIEVPGKRLGTWTCPTILFAAMRGVMNRLDELVSVNPPSPGD